MVSIRSFGVCLHLRERCNGYMINDNIPKNAIGIYVEYGKFRGKIWVWPIVSTRQERWQWACLGGNGEEEKREQAIEAARCFIRNEKINLT